MEQRNCAEELYIQLKELEKQITGFELEYGRPAASRKGAADSLPQTAAETPVEAAVPPGTPGREWGNLERLRDLLISLKEGSRTDIAGALLRENDLPTLRQEIAAAKYYISKLQGMLEREPAAEDSLKADLALTEEEDLAHNQLEMERREFKTHYDALEHDFENREKKLLEELRDIGERATKQELELEHMRIELQTTREKLEAAELKASSLSMEMMEMNVFNKSAAVAIKERDMEIGDLKQALQEIRGAAGKAGPQT